MNKSAGESNRATPSTSGTLSRRTWLASSVATLVMATPAARALAQLMQAQPANGGSRPNILFIISDDQSYPHTGADGMTVVPTPHMDRLAREGVRFTHAFVPSPSCSPSRASILTGQTPNRLGTGARLSGPLSDEHPRYPQLLAEAGYHVGYAGKGYSPAWLDKDRETKPGPRFNDFNEFLARRPEGAPFCFWFGSQNPHRPFLQAVTDRRGVRPEDVPVPPFLMDTLQTRQDLAHYYAEIAELDDEVGELMEILERTGEADNTIVVLCSDNGMPFPRAKCNLYDAGAQTPLLIRWPVRIAAGQVIDAFTNLADLAPTFLQAAGLPIPEPMNAVSLLPWLVEGIEKPSIPPGSSVGPDRDAVFLVREQHVPHSDGGGYSSRAIRTADYLYILNLEPDRWPAGPPDQKSGQFPNGFPDVDEGNAPDDVRVRGGGAKEDIVRAFERGEPLGLLALGKRPAEELYVVKDDPYQMNNVADDPRYAQVKQQLAQRLRQWMQDSGDQGVAAPARTGS